MDMFTALLQAVLRGEFSVATGDSEPPKGGSGRRVEVLMLPTAPGAVALHTAFISEVAVLDRLRQVAMRDRPHVFSADDCPDLFAAERRLWEALWRDVDGEAVPLILIPGEDALRLLRDISRLLNREIH